MFIAVTSEVETTIKLCIIYFQNQMGHTQNCGPAGLMVKASDFESEDCRFESCVGLSTFCLIGKASLYFAGLVSLEMRRNSASFTPQRYREKDNASHYWWPPITPWALGDHVFNRAFIKFRIDLLVISLASRYQNDRFGTSIDVRDVQISRTVSTCRTLIYETSCD